jgi:hypothetical protein
MLVCQRRQDHGIAEFAVGQGGRLSQCGFVGES